MQVCKIHLMIIKIKKIRNLSSAKPFIMLLLAMGSNGVAQAAMPYSDGQQVGIHIGSESLNVVRIWARRDFFCQPKVYDAAFRAKESS